MAEQSDQPTGAAEGELESDFFLVVHPLDDYPEEKLKSDHLPPIEMTLSVRWSLIALRAYLILMILLCFYHVIDLAGQAMRK
ncbi:MAG: hypothetical protein WB586_05300 [Chthoniobacterales bacterium]